MSQSPIASEPITLQLAPEVIRGLKAGALLRSLDLNAYAEELLREEIKISLQCCAEEIGN